MIVTNIFAGFGNQLFMYACGYAVSKRLKTKLMIDASYIANDPMRKYELSHLKIKYDSYFGVDMVPSYLLRVIIRKLRHFFMFVNYSSLHERNKYVFNPEIEHVGDNTRLFGYWQTERYFESCRNDLLEMFKPSYELSLSCKQLIDDIHTSNSVSVHIRRGDYVQLGICLGADYYKRAIEYIKSKVEDPIFYIFSDDTEYAESMFGDITCNYKIAKYDPVNASIDDLFVMKECQHNIIANSSYSWWGAWLNENEKKIVICPQRKTKDEFFPNEWIQL